MTTEDTATMPSTAPIVVADPAVAHSDDGFVPTEGTGLAGAVYVTGESIWNISKLREIMEGDPQLTFTATEVVYGANSSDTSVAEFLADDAESLSGDGSIYEMGPSGLSFTGYIYIPPGDHEISVISDDGFALSLGGQPFSSYEGTRGSDETSQIGTFEGGLYEIDLIYFDAGGRMDLTLAIDGLPVDQSALYLSEEDFLNPPDDVELVSAETYHPSAFLGPESLDTPIDGTGTEAHDIIEGLGADDTISGLGGDDILNGGYGDDILLGGDGDDVLDGGRGSDVLDGGDGNDTLVSRSDTGITRIGQLAIGMPTREDPDEEVNNDLQILKGYEDQPLIGDDVLIGGAGSDTFLISPQINAKLDIIEEHVRADGTINWAGVAGENDELHDHWVDGFGIDIIADYNAAEDQIAVIGHTANVYVEHKDVIGDEALESIVTVISNQHGNGGAHDMDLMGQIIVHGDLVYAEDIVTDDNVTYGIINDESELAEARYPQGETKSTLIDGVVHHGYDTRSPMEMAGEMDMHGGNGLGTTNAGPITGDPAAFFENDNFTEDMLSVPEETEAEPELTRGTFDQLGVEIVEGDTITGTGMGDTLTQLAGYEETGLPGAIGYWSFADGIDGAYGDARGEGSDIKAYSLYESQAHIRTDGATDGPGGVENSALYFNGETDFAYLAHDPSHEVSQGTIALWVRPDDLTDFSMIVSKDEKFSGEGGHFRLGHTEDGGLFLRMAPGDGGSNVSWETNGGILTEGEWQHLAVSFTDSGVTVYVDGDPIPANAWTPVEGSVPSPNVYTEAYILQNEEPWVFGADQHRTEANDTAQEFATDAEDLRNPFEGSISDFGLWGGYSSDDALSEDEINELIEFGPGEALTNPSGPQPMIAADDTFYAGGGADTVDAGAGDDTVYGEGGNDDLFGGYGNDMLDGGMGNDHLDGGRGSDLLIGGDGDDVLKSGGDVGEDRIGQLVLGEPSRPYPDPSVDPEYLKLVDWVDQPIVGDDVLVGGAGNDTFLFETYINAKEDILLDHVMPDRSIHWHGVAGENDRVHDHWVDGFGIDVIADYNAEEDTIAVIGHTTQVKVDYTTVDTDGDGVDDDAVSIITAYSQQGKNGGAHDEDILGYIVVHGDRVDVEDIVTDAGAHYGIVDTIDELQEALAPTGETAWQHDGLFGYDSRDVEGDPIGSDPRAYSHNEWLQNGEVTFASAVPEGTVAPEVVLLHEGGDYTGAVTTEIAHTDAQELASGTVAFSFVADLPGNAQDQALISKDHSGYEDGGHLTIYITGNGHLKVRFQGTDSEEYLYMSDKVVAGETYNVAFTFDESGTQLFVNGDLVDEGDGFASGMSGNQEDLVIGASTRTRQGDDDNLQWHFNGHIENVAMYDRVLGDGEVVFLDAADSDPDGLLPLYGEVTAEATETEPASEPEDPSAPGDPESTGENVPASAGPEPEANDPVETSDTSTPPTDTPVVEDPEIEDPLAEDPAPIFGGRFQRLFSPQTVEESAPAPTTEATEDTPDAGDVETASSEPSSGRTLFGGRFFGGRLQTEQTTFNATSETSDQPIDAPDEPLSQPETSVEESEQMFRSLFRFGRGPRLEGNDEINIANLEADEEEEDLEELAL